jgi:hypothetical protein
VACESTTSRGAFGAYRSPANPSEAVLALDSDAAWSSVSAPVPGAQATEATPLGCGCDKKACIAVGSLYQTSSENFYGLLETS